MAEVFGEALKNRIRQKIALAAPLTMTMMAVLFENSILSKNFERGSFHWFLSLLGFFLSSTFSIGALSYFYCYLDHRCKGCGKFWVRTKEGYINIATTTKNFSLIFFSIFIKSEEMVKIYLCQSCKHLEHKKSKRWSFIGLGPTK